MSVDGLRVCVCNSCSFSASFIVFMGGVPLGCRHFQGVFKRAVVDGEKIALPRRWGFYFHFSELKASSY